MRFCIDFLSDDYYSSSWSIGMQKNNKIGSPIFAVTATEPFRDLALRHIGIRKSQIQIFRWIKTGSFWGADSSIIMLLQSLVWVGGYEKQVEVTFFLRLTHKPPKPVSRPKIWCKKLIQTQSVEKNLPDGPKNRIFDKF